MIASMSGSRTDNGRGITRIAVFASGKGSNMEAVLRSIDRGDLRNTRIVLVVSNNSGAGALSTARRRGIETAHISSRTHPHGAACEQALLELLAGRRVDLILLAGYMKMLPPRVVRAFSGRILNIHPALLPRHGGRGMYGERVHRAVLEAGDRESGATVHLVTEEYDEGEILLQERVPVLEEDTPESLAARVLEAEHRLYWRAVDRVVNGGHATGGTAEADEEEKR